MLLDAYRGCSRSRVLSTRYSAKWSTIGSTVATTAKTSVRSLFGWDRDRLFHFRLMPSHGPMCTGSSPPPMPTLRPGTDSGI